MMARITDYRGGRHTQKPNQMVLEADGVSTREGAAELVGRQVVWESPSGKKIIGRVTGTHGSKGRVRALFGKGLPGQAIGTQAEIR